MKITDIFQNKILRSIDLKYSPRLKVDIVYGTSSFIGVNNMKNQSKYHILFKDEKRKNLIGFLGTGVKIENKICVFEISDSTTMGRNYVNKNEDFIFQEYYNFNHKDWITIENTINEIENSISTIDEEINQFVDEFPVKITKKFKVSAKKFFQLNKPIPDKNDYSNIPDNFTKKNFSISKTKINGWFYVYTEDGYRIIIHISLQECKKYLKTIGEK